jgi:serine/threonine protein phosphatase PrpC
MAWLGGLLEPWFAGASAAASAAEPERPSPDGLLFEPSVFVDAAQDAARCASRVSISHVGVGVSAMQGRRPTMEDAHVAITDLHERADLCAVASAVKPGAAEMLQGCVLAAIFDGHGSDKTACFCAQRLPLVLMLNPLYHEGDIEGALRETIRRLDEEALTMAGEHGWRCGATVCVVHINTKERKIVQANAGDSEAFVAQANGHIQRLSVRHTPEAESARILAAGGTVHGGRVQGTLAVARALGDAAFKAPIVTAIEGIHGSLITAEPFVYTYEYDDAALMVVLACDGMYERIAHCQVAAHCCTGLSKSRAISNPEDAAQTAEDIAQMAVDLAYESHSLDNISCVVVLLPRSASPEPEDSVPSSP